MSEKRTNYSTGPIPATWRDALDERQRKQIAFAETYIRDFNHGAIGHNDYILIAKLAEILDVAAGSKEPPKQVEPHEVRIMFGKAHYGQTLGEILRVDWGYVEWLAREGRDEAIRAAAAAMLASPPRLQHQPKTQEPSTEPENEQTEDLPF